MRKKEKKNSICGERRRNNAHIPLPERGCVEARLNSCSITPFAPSPSRNFARKIFFRSAPQQPHDKYVASPTLLENRSSLPRERNTRMYTPEMKTTSSLARSFPKDVKLKKKKKEIGNGRFGKYFPKK